MQPDDLPLFVNPGEVLPRPSVLAGFDGDWGSLTPTVWQALAGPAGQHALPSLDWAVSQERGSDAAFDAPFPIWSAVLELLNYSFGWRSPAVAVARWLETGLPTTDRRLEVIAHLLGSDLEERVTNLAAFLYLQGGWSLSRYGHGGLIDLFGEDESRYPTIRIPQWVRDEYKRRGCGDDHRGPYEAAPYFLPCRSGGFDNMHLSGHCWMPILRTAERQGAPLRGGSISDAEPSRFFSQEDGEHGRAVLMTQQYGGWFDELVAHGKTLPALESGRSWRVDVVCAPIGWLGTYRKSRETGLWFSGPHSSRGR